MVNSKLGLFLSNLPSAHKRITAMESSTSAVTTTYKPLKGMHVPQTSWTNRMEEVCACGRCWEFETPSAAIAPSPKTTKSSSRLPLNAKKSSPWSMSVRKRHSFSGANRGAVMDSTSNNLGTPEPYSTKLRVSFVLKTPRFNPL